MNELEKLELKISLAEQQDAHIDWGLAFRAREKSPNELHVDDIRVGHGIEVKAGDTVRILFMEDTYTGGRQGGWVHHTYRDRDESLNDWDNKSFEFVLGDDEPYMKGLDQGMEGMRVWGKRQLFIPAHLAYGDGRDRERGDGRYKDSEIVIVIELVGAVSSSGERAGTYVHAPARR